VYTSLRAVKTEDGVFKVMKDVDESGRHTAVLALEDGATPNDAIKAIIAQGLTVNSFKELVPRMNDIFIKLVTEEE
jgi:ABC-2 type transport system ATP-binding protein